MPDLWFETALLSEGWTKGVRLTIEDGVIAGIERSAPPAPGDALGAAAIPGLCDVHSHAFQRGMAGLTEFSGPTDDDFWTWRALMYRFLDRIDPEDAEAIAAQAYVEMLESGFTRVGEFHYLHHDPDGAPYADRAIMAKAVISAARQTGIGLTLLPVFYAHANFGGAPPVHGQRRFLNTLDGFAALVDESRTALSELPDANMGLAPHSLRAATAEELLGVAALAADGPIHIHVAEQTREVEDCIAFTGQRPVDWLLSHMNLDPRWCLVHATHLTQEETAGLAASGAVAGLCPITEANLGDGVFPTDAYLALGGAFGVGSDSNILIDPAQELRALEYAQRLTRRARNVLARSPGASTGASLYKAALAGGSQALGQAGAGLALGACADIVALDLGHVALYGREGDALLDGWLFSGTRGVVKSVWRRGERVVVEGRHRRAEAVAQRYRRALDKLLSA